MGQRRSRTRQAAMRQGKHLLPKMAVGITKGICCHFSNFDEVDGVGLVIAVIVEYYLTMRVYRC